MAHEETLTELALQPLGRPRGHAFPDSLRELAAFDATPEWVVSLYLDVCWDDETKLERTRLLLKDQLRRLRLGIAPEGPGLGALSDLARVAAYVDERLRRPGAPHERGEAVFLSSARGFERGLRTSTVLPTGLLVGPMPWLRPLVQALPHPGRVLCVVTDSVSTRIYDLDGLDGSGGGLWTEVVGDVPRRHHAGGWSQLKLQHWRTEEIAHQHRRALEALTQAFAADPTLRILVAGRHNAMHALLAEASPGLAERIELVDGLGIDPGSPEDQVLAAFQAALEKRQLEAAVREAGRLGGVASAPLGRAAAGPEAVAMAASEGRLRSLFLDSTPCRDGAR